MIYYGHWHCITFSLHNAVMVCVFSLWEVGKCLFLPLKLMVLLGIFHGFPRVPDPHCSATNGARSTNKLNEVLRLDSWCKNQCKTAFKKSVSSWSNSVVVRYLVLLFFPYGALICFLTLSCLFIYICTACAWVVSRRIFFATKSPGFVATSSGAEASSIHLASNSVCREKRSRNHWHKTQNHTAHLLRSRTGDILLTLSLRCLLFAGWKGKLPLNQRWILIEIKPTICQQYTSLQWSWLKTWTSWAPATSLWPLAGCRSTESKWHVSQMPFQGINILRLIPKDCNFSIFLNIPFCLYREINSCKTLRKGMGTYLAFVKNVMAVICV